MKAVLCKSLDGPDALELQEIATVAPGPGQIALKIEAVSLNFFDTLMCRGKYQHRPDLPFSPGGEAAGAVIAVGEGVSQVQVGQRVVCYMGVNGCRQELIVDAQKAIAIPEGLSSEIASVLPVTYGTAMHGLEDRGHLKAGETLLVLGASGGAGLAAVELGRRMGARVIAAGTSDEKLQICAKRGAAHLLNLTDLDLKEAVRHLTGGEGVDVIYDCIGGPYAEPALRAMAWGGRYLVVGFAAGDIPKIPLNLLLLKGCAMIGVFFGHHAQLERARFAEQMQRLMTWAVVGEIHPHIDHVFALEETAEALRSIEARKIKGKVVIKP